MIGPTEAAKMIAQIEAAQLEVKGMKIDLEKNLARLKMVSADLERIREKLL